MNPSTLIYDQAAEAADYLSSYGSPLIGVIQGTGLSRFAGQLVNKFAIPYSDIPHLSQSTVPTHESVCTIGNVGSATVIAFSGRLHYYEGHSMNAVTFPVRVMQLLGVKYLLMSNAAGGLNPLYAEGDLVLVKDHINTFPENPLRDMNDPRLGVTFPDLSEAYSKTVRSTLSESCEENHLSPLQGVYLGLQGPSLETPAEYRSYQKMGADLIGMSTVPEVIVANQAEIETGVLSVVTNTFNPDRITITTIDDVIATAEAVEPTVIKVIMDTIYKLQEL